MDAVADQSNFVAMWVTPALVGGMLGWPGIWGGGTAFSDLILPAPITGGIVHVPTFVLAIFLVRAYPKMPTTAASVVRAALMGASLIGLAHLVDLDRIALSFSTDLALRGIPWQRLRESNAFRSCRQVSDELSGNLSA